MTKRGRVPCQLADLGMVTALGNGRDLNASRLFAGDASHLGRRDDLIPDQVRRFGSVAEALPELAASLARYDCRNNRLSLMAFEAIRPGVERAIAELGAERVGIVGGSSTRGLAEAEVAVRQWTRDGSLPSAFDLVQLEYGGVSEFMQQISGARGPCYSLSTACSTGAKALASARTLLDLDLCDAVVAGATDSLCRLTANGFFALQAISDDVPNPMSRNRDGLILGEGAAWFLMTREPGGVQLLGVGESSDAYHMSAPDPTGRGAGECMRAALADAGVRPEAITYVNLHGTATPQNDAMENRAVHRVFGDRVACSSTKPLVGHTLGASGAIEAAFCWLVLDCADGHLPAHLWDGEHDPDLPNLHLVDNGETIPTDVAPLVMTNSFGFGGTNCSLVLGISGT